ncbi:pentapeptide repeat-containing protein [Actinokineospora enzanensis]|uniref:pentapeptide repeat-containing protein n=1 Tax=Actinokineospora enzanensis TaxID=155975 RepID=UPI0003672043|nr:pentapeptide repeat-containing protein [Actinokineospora enzanensis]
MLSNLDVTAAVFTEDADFSKVDFGGMRATFADAVFAGQAIFREASFEVDANFGTTTFKRGAIFTKTTFADRAFFKGAAFGGAGFELATFRGPAVFNGAKFEKSVTFHNASFEESCYLLCEVGASVSLTQCRFAKGLEMGYTIVGEVFDLSDSHFLEPSTWASLLAARQVNLSGAVFDGPLEADIVTHELVSKKTNWRAGVRLRLAGADADLSGAIFGEPSTLACRSDWIEPIPFSEANRKLSRRIPRLTSLIGANVDKLTIADVSIAACRLIEAHNLDKLRLEGADLLARTPANWRWTSRLTVAEEHHWRARHHEGKRQRDWYGPATQPHAWADTDVGNPHPAQSPARIAETYRGLRKSREDAKDEPGAADFYYGEMEMRRAGFKALLRGDVAAASPRQTRRSARVEYALLTAYWFVSGYGLRAWRALALFGLLVLLTSVYFALWGIPPNTPVAGLSFPGRWSHGLLMSLESATSLIRAPGKPVTTAGEWVVLLLCYLGPILLALAALAVRARVKR